MRIEGLIRAEDGILYHHIKVSNSCYIDFTIKYYVETEGILCIYLQDELAQKPIYLRKINSLIIVKNGKIR